LFDVFIFIRRTDEVAVKIYDPSLPGSLLKNGDIYNAMIYPFTRMVIYGAIWYQGRMMR
jgi:hypothetical protein